MFGDRSRRFQGLMGVMGVLVFDCIQVIAYECQYAVFRLIFYIRLSIMLCSFFSEYLFADEEKFVSFLWPFLGEKV